MQLSSLHKHDTAMHKTAAAARSRRRLMRHKHSPHDLQVACVAAEELHLCCRDAAPGAAQLGQQLAEVALHCRHVSVSALAVQPLHLQVQAGGWQWLVERVGGRAGSRRQGSVGRHLAPACCCYCCTATACCVAPAANAALLLQRRRCTHSVVACMSGTLPSSGSRPQPSAVWRCRRRRGRRSSSTACQARQAMQGPDRVAGRLVCTQPAMRAHHTVSTQQGGRAASLTTNLRSAAASSQKLEDEASRLTAFGSSRMAATSDAAFAANARTAGTRCVWCAVDMAGVGTRQGLHARKPIPEGCGACSACNLHSAHMHAVLPCSRMLGCVQAWKAAFMASSKFSACASQQQQGVHS